ncbi:MAG: glycosyltransferase [Chitinivibrionales bacterium]|nr:glycosyltransferase [Chitinivibrionales bacterium]
MPSKSILIFSEDYPPYPGGIAQWAAGVAGALASRDLRVTVITRYREKYQIVEDAAANLAVIQIKKNNWKKLRTLYCRQALASFLHNNPAPDALIATTWNNARGLISLCRKNRITLITVVHGLEVTRSMHLLKRIWLRGTLSCSHKIISVSRFTANHLKTQLSIPDERIVILPNGVNPNRFRPNINCSKLRKRYHLEGKAIFLTLARVIERKGHDCVLKALPRVLDSVPNASYIICGPYEPTYFAQLQQLVTDLNLHDRVIFTGQVPANELPFWYNLCDVYIMTSRKLASGDSEGFGITYLEANACEKPVIGGRSGGVSDAVEDGLTGFLVDPADSDEIADKLILLLSDCAQATRMGKAGRKRVLSAYTWERIAQRLGTETGILA